VVERPDLKVTTGDAIRAYRDGLIAALAEDNDMEVGQEVGSVEVIDGEERFDCYVAHIVLGENVRAQFMVVSYNGEENYFYILDYVPHEKSWAIRPQCWATGPGGKFPIGVLNTTAAP
jgi:hypothetical protein